MKRKTYFIFCILTALLQTVSADDLWNKAVNLVNANSLIPADIREVEKIYNGTTLLQTETAIMKVGKDNQGNYQLLLVEKRKNDKDITKKYRKKFEKEKTEFDFDFYYLFSQKTTGNVSFRKTGNTKNILSYQCQEYTFSCEKDGAVIKGFVYLDKNSGSPLELKAEIESVPFEEDGVVIKKVDYITSFTYNRQGTLSIQKTDVIAIFALSFLNYDLKSHTEYVYSGY